MTGLWTRSDLNLGLQEHSVYNDPEVFDASLIDPNGIGSGLAFGQLIGQCPSRGFIEIFYSDDTTLAQSFGVTSLYLRVVWYEKDGVVTKFNSYHASGGSYSSTKDYIPGITRMITGNPDWDAFNIGYQAACS